MENKYIKINILLIIDKIIFDMENKDKLIEDIDFLITFLGNWQFKGKREKETIEMIKKDLKEKREKYGN